MEYDIGIRLDECLASIEEIKKEMHEMNLKLNAIVTTEGGE